MSDTGLPEVLVVTLGGTIAMTGSSSNGISPTLTGSELISSVPGLENVARVRVISPLQRPGASLRLEDIRDVATLIDQEVMGETSGAVVVQGTDTIEETAFALDCLLRTEKTVVVTGAMRGAASAGADGPANILSSVVVAASGPHNRGVVVVLNDEVHAAPIVKKGHTGLVSSFVSDPFGPIGYVLEGTYQQVYRIRSNFSPIDTLNHPIPPVGLLCIGLGDDGRMVRAVQKLGYSGAVVAAMGAGHVPDEVVKALGDLAAAMPVILSTRVGSGPVFKRTYGFRGSEIDLLGRGLLHGGILGPLKSRILLQLLLAGDASRGQIDEIFTQRSQVIQ